MSDKVDINAFLPPTPQAGQPAHMDPQALAARMNGAAAPARKGYLPPPPQINGGIHNMNQGAGSRDKFAGQGDGTDSPIGAMYAKQFGGGGAMNASTNYMPMHSDPSSQAADQAVGAVQLKEMRTKAAKYDPWGAMDGGQGLSSDEEFDDPILGNLDSKRINFNTSGVYEAVESSNASVKGFDVMNPNGVVVAKDMLLREAAEALAMCFNRGIYINSLAVRNIIDADLVYGQSRNEAAKYKNLYEKYKNNSGAQDKAREAERRFEEFKTKALKAKELLKNALYNG